MEVARQAVLGVSLLMPYKQPISALVVIYTASPSAGLRTGLEVLLIERADSPATGSR